jgi:hypothetical protein
VTIELKRGYSKYTCFDALDKIPGQVKATHMHWETWLHQVWESWELSGSYAWLLITKRDRREEMVFMPDFLYRNLPSIPSMFPRMTMRFRFDNEYDDWVSVVCMQLKTFLSSYSRRDILTLLAKA